MLSIQYNSFHNTGTHWVHEIISMLLAGRAENVPRTKADGMMEFMSHDQLEQQPSPRVLNSHLPRRYLPAQMTGNSLSRFPEDFFCEMPKKFTKFQVPGTEMKLNKFILYLDM